MTGSGPEIPERPFLWTSVLGVIRFGDGDGGEVAVSVIHAECVRLGYIAPSTLWPERDPETRAFLLARLAHIQRIQAPCPPSTARPSDAHPAALATVPVPLPLAIVRVRTSWWRRLLSAFGRTRSTGGRADARSYCSRCGLPRRPHGHRTQRICTDVYELRPGVLICSTFTVSLG